MKNGTRKTNKVRLHVRISPQIFASLTAQAARQNVTVTWVLENALRAHLSQKADR